MPASKVQQIQKLESQAQVRPALFRAKVALMAVAGEAGFQLALIFPIALSLFFGAVWFNRIVLLWAALGGTLLLWWVMQPSFHVPGKALARDQAPELHDLVDRLLKSCDGLKIHEIRIDDSFNAGAMELGRGWIPGRVRRVLLIGGPLLASVSQSALEAILAHELGHLSREHGRLGHWVYRARLSWMETAAYGKDASFIDQAAAAFAQHFGTWFDPYAFVLSRRCEYEADATGARAVGNEAFAAALAEVEWLVAARAQFLQDEIRNLQREFAEPPADLWQRMAARIRREEPGPWLARAWAEESGALDTHPCLRERAAALGVDYDSVVAAACRLSRHGANGLGGGALCAYGAQLDPAQALEWSLAHARLQRPTAVRHGTTADEECFTQALRLIDEQSEQAVPLLKALIERDPSWAAPARLAIARLPARCLPDVERERNRELLDKALQRRAQAAESGLLQLEEGTVTPRPCAGAVVEAMRACLLGQSRLVPELALGEVDVTLQENRRYRLVVLALAIDAEVMRGRGLTDDDVADAYRAQLAELVAANAIVVAVPRFTGEPLPKWAASLQPLAS